MTPSSDTYSVTMILPIRVDSPPIRIRNESAPWNEREQASWVVHANLVQNRIFDAGVSELWHELRDHRRVALTPVGFELRRRRRVGREQQVILVTGLEHGEHVLYLVRFRDRRPAHQMTDRVESQKCASSGERFGGLRQRLGIRSNRGEMTDTHASGIDPYGFEYIELFNRAGRAALMRRVGEDGQVRSTVSLADRAKQL